MVAPDPEEAVHLLAVLQLQADHRQVVVAEVVAVVRKILVLDPVLLPALSHRDGQLFDHLVELAVYLLPEVVAEEVAVVFHLLGVEEVVGFLPPEVEEVVGFLPPEVEEVECHLLEAVVRQSYLMEEILSDFSSQ